MNEIRIALDRLVEMRFAIKTMKEEKRELEYQLTSMLEEYKDMSIKEAFKQGLISFKFAVPEELIKHWREEIIERKKK